MKIELQHLFFLSWNRISVKSRQASDSQKPTGFTIFNGGVTGVSYLIWGNILLNTRAGVSLLGHWCQCCVNKWLEQDSGSVAVNVITKTGTRGLESSWVETYWTRGSPERGRTAMLCDANMHFSRTPVYSYKLFAFDILHLIYFGYFR